MRDPLRYVFELAPRLVALITLYGVVEAILSGEVFTRLQWLFSTSLPSSIIQVVFLVYIATAVLTILTGSPYAYTLSIVMFALGGGNVGYQYVLPLFVILVFDNLRSTYRRGELASVRVENKRSIIIALTWGLFLMGIFAAVGLFLGLYVHGLIICFIESSNPLTRTIAENIVVRIALFTGLAYVSYKLVSEVGEIIVLFALPSRSISLTELRSSKPPFVIDAPLSTLRSLIIASVLAPLAYAGVEKLLDILLPHALNDYYKLLVSMAVFIGVWRLVSLAFKLYDLRVEPKAILLGVTSVWLIIYLAGVVLSTVSGRSLPDSLTAPDMGGVASIAAETYLEYYVRYISLIEALIYIMGVAP